MNAGSVVQITLLCVGLLFNCAAGSQTFPTRPIRMVVPAAPGGGVDIAARMIAPKLSEYLGQQVIIDNRGGAGTMIGSESVMRAKPDGYTLLLPSAPLAINPAMYKKVPYDGVKDFAHITQISSVPNVLVAHPSLPIRNVVELIAFAKSHPGQLQYASAGTGTAPHLFMELFLNMTGLKMIHVPYKGSGPGMIDVIGGQVPLMAPLTITALGHLRDGRLRALGITGAKRIVAAPDIPTIAQAGVPGYEASNWIGVSSTAGTPPEIVSIINGQLLRVLRLSEVKSRMENDGAEVVGSTPEEFSNLIRLETAKWAKVVKSAGIEPE